MAETFGQRIRARRKDLGLTLDQLAEAAGCSKSYIWELGEQEPASRPSAEKLSSIATALKTTSDYLLALDTENECVGDRQGLLQEIPVDGRHD